MSEAEKRKRAEYRRNRKKWLTVIIAAITLVSIVSLVFAAIYLKMNGEAYTTYTESGKTAYRVNYKPGFKGESEEGRVYIGDGVDSVKASFDYVLLTDSDDVEFEYEYSILTEVQFANRDGVLDTYKKDFIKEIVPPVKKTVTGNTLEISDTVLIDYEYYNNLAKDYVETHSLEGFTDTLIVTLRVDVLSSCDATDGECTANTYFTSVNIPLTEATFKIDVSESVGEAEKQILDKNKAAAALFFGKLALGGVGFDALLILLLLAFAYLTRNTDINYTIKVNKIVTNYRSYIQKITNGFDSKGYQVLMVDTFREMLEIRDTIESPILMSENEDFTRTQFLIPTGTKLLYVYEIKVDNYDELYAATESDRNQAVDASDDYIEYTANEELESEVAEVEVCDTPAVEEPIPESEKTVAENAITDEDITEAVILEIDEKDEIPLAEADENEAPAKEEVTVAEPIFATAAISTEAREAKKTNVLSMLTIPSEVEPEDNDNTEAPVAEVVIEMSEDMLLDGFDAGAMTKYDYSFEARLALSDEESRGYYSEIIAFIKSWGVKVSRSWKRERIYFGRKTYANFVFKAGRLSLAFALDPATQDEKYGFIDMSESGRYAKTPALMKLTSKRKKKYATDLLSEMFKADGLKDKKLAVEPEYVPFRTRLTLINQELIKMENGEKITVTQKFIDEHQRHEGTEHHIIKLENVEVEVLQLDDVTVNDEEIAEAMAAPELELSKIDYDDDTDPIDEKEEEDEFGVEVIGVVWPEKTKHNKIYRYDPNGEKLHEGDVVLAPSRDVARNKDIVRKVAVAHANHKVAPEDIKHPLKKIIGIVKRRAEAMLTPSDEKVKKLLSEDDKKSK